MTSRLSQLAVLPVCTAAIAQTAWSNEANIRTRGEARLGRQQVPVRP
ncbi:MAG: hypothetical protein IPH43_02375 [Xanthomonadales bacterium]|nr:hypothetical protein [Xanthomonadales bacterium]